MILTGIRFKVFITLMLALAVAGCSRDDVPDTPYPSTSTKTMKVAVVAPIGDAATKTRMERTAGWFAANFIEAQQGDSIQVRLEPEWYDELSTDLETLSKELAGREDIIAIIGPFSNENIDGHMLFGMNGKNCRTTVINGRLLYKDRRFTDLDEERINAWTMEQSKVLWGELNHRPY